MGSSAHYSPEQKSVSEPTAGSLPEPTELHQPDSRSFWPEDLGPSVADATVISAANAAGQGQFGGLQPAGGTVVPAPSHELSKLLAGERLGHYELIEFAGGGGMGAVFRGRDVTLNREVAIKVLSRDQACDDETLKRFKNEAQSAARLDHENIARVYYVGEDKGLHFIVFEFIEGVNVRQLVEKIGRIALDDAVSYTLQVADALSHASAREIVHRDIKPSNIIITAQGRAKLVDMGLARLHGIQPGAEDLTASGVTLGTFDYISPEQARDPRGADVRSDIYSLGCTLYYMLTGRPPFPEGTVLQKLLQHNSDDPIDPREFNPNLPEALTVILRKMLAKDPLRRYQTPADLIADLLHLAERVGIRRAEVRLATKWEANAQAPSAWQRHLPWIVPVAALAAIIVGLEFYDRTRDDDWNTLGNDPRTTQASGSTADASKPKSADGTKPTTPNTAGSSTVAGSNDANDSSNGDTVTTPAPLPGGTSGNSSVVAAPTGTAAPSVAFPTTIAKIDLKTPFVNSTSPAVAPLIDMPGTSVDAPATTVAAGASTPNSPTTPTAPRKLPEARDGVLVVCDTADETGRYTTLRAACFAAKNGDVVELCYDGERVERPLVLNNLKLTVRAGDGYRPAIRFRPAEAAIPNLPHMMAAIVGGRLTMVGLEIAFDVPSPQDFPANRWSLFELQHAEYLGLERCVLTVNNASADGAAYHPNVALLGTSLPPGAPSTMNMPMSSEGGSPLPAVEAAEVWFDHCVVRGETSLLRAAELQPVSLHWNDGLLAVSESALVVAGGSMQPKEVDVRMALNHVTAACGGSLIEIHDDFDAPYLPTITASCADSIVYSVSGAPLVDYDGIDVRTDFLKTFHWTGERVFYEGFKADSFWRLASGDDVAQMLSFDDWRAQWGTQRDLQTVWRDVRWKRPLAQSPIFHTLRPDDFALDDSGAGQKALRGAADGNDVGMNRTQLPVVGSLSKTDGDLRAQAVGASRPYLPSAPLLAAKVYPLARSRRVLRGRTLHRFIRRNSAFLGRPALRSGLSPLSSAGGELSLIRTILRRRERRRPPSFPPRHRISEPAHMIRAPLLFGRSVSAVLLAGLFSLGCAASASAAEAQVEFKKGDHVVIVGNTLAERMQYFGGFETLLHSRYPQLELVVRDLGWSADELTLRPRSKDFRDHKQTLADHKPNVLIAMFGFDESFKGEAGFEQFKKDLESFLAAPQRIDDYATSRSNWDRTPDVTKAAPKIESLRQIVLVSPIAFENLGLKTLSDGSAQNKNLELYTAAMKSVAEKHKVPFVDLYQPSLAAMQASKEKPLTINGIHLNEHGDQVVGKLLDEAMFGTAPKSDIDLAKLHAEVQEKNLQFFYDYRAINGFYIYGGRKAPFGVVNFPAEFEKLRKMISVRDRRIWDVAQGKPVSAVIDDSQTGEFTKIETNFPKPITILPPPEAAKTFELPEGYAVNLFASEVEFPELANPVQISFDAKGRLWVTTMESYPMYLPGTPVSDKILILEDTDGDGKADKSTVFADGLHVPTGFEFGRGGVFVAQQPNVMFLKDTDGDDKADVRELVLHGFDSADSHHSISAFTYDQGGALYFEEGTFHHSQIETPYGPERCVNAGVFRWEPRTWKLDVWVSYGFANPWGHVVDSWGQNFVADASGGANYFGAAFSGDVDYPNKHGKLKEFLVKQWRPTAGCELVSSRNFPPEAQGNYLLNNCIGFQGVLQYKMREDKSGYAADPVDPLLKSSDPNFRPVDLEFGPDGALYVCDWFNPLVGHMQHNVRDPNRDHKHGRIWRIAYTKNPLVKPAKIEGEPIAALLNLLKNEPEERTRYRVRIELWNRNSDDVMTELKSWTAGLDAADANYEHHLLESLWLKQAFAVVDEPLLAKMLKSPEPKARAAATRVLCYWRDQVKEPLKLIQQQVNDEHPRVRLEALRALSFFHTQEAIDISVESLLYEDDDYLKYVLAETTKTLDARVKNAAAAKK